MHDQASQLRALVRSAAKAEAHSALAPPRKIAISGAKGGVGVTTVAVHLSIALAGQGSRVVLVDADMNHPDVASLCQLEPRNTIADVLAARRTVHEALHRGPAGIQILPGVWSATMVPDCSPAAQNRLLRELDCLGRHADFVVLDVGSGLNHVLRRFWHAADSVLLITTPDRMAIVDAYAAIKVLGAPRSDLHVELLVNRADADTAAATHRRMDHACQRFLKRRLELAGHIGIDERRIDTGACAQPDVNSGDSLVAADVQRISERLLAVGITACEQSTMCHAAA
jgi:flagellar biosynthesis protein FlhG